MTELINIVDTDMKFNSNTVRIIGTSENPLFVVKDICNILGLKNPTDVLRNISDRWKTLANVKSTSGIQNSLVVTEAGLYKIIMRSNKPIAEPFQEWVCETVLPSIRKTGEFKIEEYKKKIESLEKVIQTKQKVIEDVVKESHTVSLSYKHLLELHDNLRKKKGYYKFKQGKCCYIVSDSWRHKSYYKVGESSNINERLKTYRTSMPMCRIEFLVYLEDNALLEKNIKKTYEDNLNPNNHEYVSGVSLEDLISSFKTSVNFHKLKVTYEEELDKYNNFYQEHTPKIDLEKVEDHDTKEIILESLEFNDTEIQEAITKQEEAEIEKSVREEEQKKQATVILNTIMKCSICMKEYKSAPFLRRHMISVHNQKIEPVSKQCAICKKEFSNVGKLNRHMATVHEKSNIVKCDQCNKFYNSKGALDSHIKNTHKKEGVIKCELCDKYIVNKGNYDKHMRNIHADSSIKCDICDKICNSKEYLAHHIKYVHERAGKTICKICNGVFLTNGGYRYHMGFVHKTVLEN